MLTLIVEVTNNRGLGFIHRINGGVGFNHRVSSMVIAGVFLRGGEQFDPAFHLRRKSSRSGQRNRWLDPSVVSHGKRLYALSTCAVRRACAIASVREQDRADGGSVRAIAVSVWI